MTSTNTNQKLAAAFGQINIVDQPKLPTFTDKPHEEDTRANSATPQPKKPAAVDNEKYVNVLKNTMPSPLRKTYLHTSPVDAALSRLSQESRNKFHQNPSDLSIPDLSNISHELLNTQRRPLQDLLTSRLFTCLLNKNLSKLKKDNNFESFHEVMLNPDSIKVKSGVLTEEEFQEVGLSLLSDMSHIIATRLKGISKFGDISNNITKVISGNNRPKNDYKSRHNNVSSKNETYFPPAKIEISKKKPYKQKRTSFEKPKTMVDKDGNEWLMTPK